MLWMESAVTLKLKGVTRKAKIFEHQQFIGKFGFIETHKMEILTWEAFRFRSSFFPAGHNKDSQKFFVSHARVSERLNKPGS